MNDSPEDIFSLLNLSSLAPPAIEDNNVLLGSNWQVSAESKNEISSLSVPVVALNDGRFVLQANDGQFYLLAMSSNYANEEESLPEIETNYSIPNATTFHESESVADEVESEVNTVSVDEEPEKVIEPSDTSSSPLVEGGEEQFLFICAQCSNLFLSVEKCRDHMIKDHNMIISNEIPEVCDEDPEFEQLPLQSIDTNSGNKEKSPTNTETTTNNIVKNDGQEKSVQENVGQENSGVKDKKSEENGDEMKEKEGKQSKKVAKANNRKRKEIASDPDYELRPFKCRHSSCVHRFRSEEALHHHTMCHTTPTRREYACSQADCNMKFDDWRHCAIHLWNLHHIDVDLHTCLICGQHKATSRKALETHMRIHGEERQFVCPECGKAFKQKSQLYNHRVTHIKKKMSLIPDAVTPRWYMEKQCTICQKVYADSKCLKKHVQAVHSKLKPYVCQVCGHSAARKAMLQAHLRQHTGEKPYACTTCDFKTGDHNSLRRHMMRHSGVKPYKCPHCSYASIQSTSFKNHLAIRHPGKEGVFECQRCAYRTVSHASYLQHCNDHNNNLINSSATGAGADQQGDVEVFPENVAAAQLIYQCLSGAGGKGSAMGGRGGGATAPFKADVTASSTSGDGTKQTITIEIPTNTSEILTTDDEDTTHCFLQPDVIDSGGITIPADPHPHPTAIVPPTVTQPSTRIITHLIEFS